MLMAEFINQEGPDDRMVQIVEFKHFRDSKQDRALVREDGVGFWLSLEDLIIECSCGSKMLASEGRHDFDEKTGSPNMLGQEHIENHPAVVCGSCDLILAVDGEVQI